MDKNKNKQNIEINYFINASSKYIYKNEYINV